MSWHRAGAFAVLATLLWISTAAALQGEEPAETPPVQQAFVLWKQGYVLHLFGDYHGAVRQYRKSIEVHPTAEGHTFLGWSLSHLGRTEEAIGECEKAIEIDPDYGNPYNDIGVYLIDLGRPDEAVPWLEKAMKAKRYCCYQYPHFNLGRILVMQGRMKEARRAFERALSYDPSYVPALKGLEFIRQQGQTL